MYLRNNNEDFDFAAMRHVLLAVVEVSALALSESEFAVEEAFASE